MFDGSVCTVFVKSRFISGKVLPSLDDCDGSLNVPGASRTEQYVIHYQKVFASLEFGAQKNC